MGTKNNPGAFDCYANAQPDEPMFVLLGRDRSAPALVWLWATLREIDGTDLKQVEEARQCSRDMIHFLESRKRQAQGLSATTLAGILELVRVVNDSVAIKPLHNAMPLDSVRRFLAQTDGYDHGTPLPPLLDMRAIVAGAIHSVMNEYVDARYKGGASPNEYLQAYLVSLGLENVTPDAHWKVVING